VHALIAETGGKAKLRHTNGVMSQIDITMADVGRKRIRIANLPPEMPNDSVRAALTPYGQVIGIQNEKWSHAYRYGVEN
jgi:hypothetical protein